MVLSGGLSVCWNFFLVISYELLVKYLLFLFVILGKMVRVDLVEINIKNVFR